MTLVCVETSLISLMSLMHSFPSLISILLKYHNSKKISFISYLIHNIFYTLNYYHNSIMVPSHINSNNEILESLTREKDECTKKCSSIPNSL